MDELTRQFVAARDGDRRALSVAIRTSQPEVWRMARHLVGADEADDVTQDVFLRAWRALPAFRAESSARTWLLAIARRACADAVRRRVRHRRLHATLRTAPQPSVVAGPEGAHALDDLVGALDLERREAFVLTQLLGCSYAEAAEICGTPVGTIRSRVARARNDLVRSLADEDTG
jgi:RNA polymerase sigma-70 factor (ECF subfamily)